MSFAPWISELYARYQAAGLTVSTDTRQITPGCLFIALKGPRFNGNLFASQALEQGASAVVVDEDLPQADERYFRVPDGLAALQELARYHRQQLAHLVVLGIGGSNGKTTTKELTGAILSRHFRTFTTPGNLNNHIGVPLCVLSLRAEHEVAVLELGANAPGEIAELCHIADPTHGLITNIGKDHLEGFGSVEGVARANSELFLHLKNRRGLVFYNTQEEHIVRMASRLSHKVSYPSPGDDYPCELLGASPFVRVRVPGTEVEITSQLVGDYNFANIATALCVARHLGVPLAKAQEAIEAYQPANMRSQVLEREHNTVILDAYNANPSSMMAALTSLSRMESPLSKGVLLGDLLELGADSAQEHRDLGTWLAQTGWDWVVLVGAEMQAAASTCPKAVYFSTRDEAEAWLSGHRPEGYLILVKGSRGIRLETLVEKL